MVYKLFSKNSVIKYNVLALLQSYKEGFKITNFKKLIYKLSSKAERWKYPLKIFPTKNVSDFLYR